MAFVERDEVRRCIGSIVSKRERLRELRHARREDSIRENLEAEISELLRSIDNLVGNLHSTMEQDDLVLWSGQKSYEAVHDNFWSLGTEEIRGPLIPILRGKLEPIRRVVVAPDLPDNVVALFMTIPGLREYLKREIHGH